MLSHSGFYLLEEKHHEFKYFEDLVQLCKKLLSPWRIQPLASLKELQGTGHFGTQLQLQKSQNEKGAVSNTWQALNTGNLDLASF